MSRKRAPQQQPFWPRFQHSPVAFPSDSLERLGWRASVFGPNITDRGCWPRQLPFCVGSVQLYFRKSCAKRSTASLVLFWVAVVVVILVILFPQLLASVIAG